MEIMRHFKEAVQNLIAPAHCSDCLRMLEERVALCDECSAQIRPIVSVDLEISKRLSVPVIALGAYEPPLTTLILAKRYRHHISAHHLGELLARHLAACTITGDYLIPVPLHWRRYAERGFNQAEIMAEQLGTKLNMSVIHPLRRGRHTAYQLHNNLDERNKNVEGAFLLDERYRGADYQGKRLIIVDDVFTTGATVRAMIKALLPLQPASIQVVVAARVA